MKKWYFILMLCIAGCAGEESNKTTEGDTAVYAYSSAMTPDTAKAAVTDTAKFDGTYSGILPCASCEGIETTLTLYTDHSFLMKEIYKGDQPDSFVNKGKYDVRNNVLYLKLDGSGVERPVMYSVRPNSLTQLDMNGKEIKGQMAGHYMLMKN